MNAVLHQAAAEELLNSKNAPGLKSAVAKLLKEEPDAALILDRAIHLEEHCNDSPAVLKLLNAARDKAAKKNPPTTPAKGKKAAHPALALTGESKLPNWDRARKILFGIKTAIRLSLAGQVLLGQELQTIKVELGFAGSGRRKENPNDLAFKSLHRTWDQWTKAELGVSDQGADNYIATYEAAKQRVKKLGGNAKLLSLLEAHPAKIDEEGHKLLSGMVDKLVEGETQKSLLEELKLVKCHVALTGGDTSKSKKKPDPQLVAQQLAFAFFSPVPATLAKVEKAIGNVRLAPDYQRFLHTLPLTSAEAGQVSLHSLKATIEAALKGDLAKALEDIDAAIQAKMSNGQQTAA
jgi:hypothetical protein